MTIINRLILYCVFKNLISIFNINYVKPMNIKIEIYLY